MKKMFIISAVAVLFHAVFIACSSNETDVNLHVHKASIGFIVASDNSHVTRGYATTAANATSTIESFRTWAYDNSTDRLYMGESTTAGRVVSNIGTALAPVWSYAPTQYWPVNTLDFVAVTPSVAPIGGSMTHSTASAMSVVTLTTSYTAPTDVVSQVDLMFAKAHGANKNDNEGNVAFSFIHGLSQITFKGRLPSNGAITKVTIAEISLCNVKKSGVFTYSSDATLTNTATTEAVFTLDASNLEAYVFEAGVNGITAGTAFDLTISNNPTKKNAWFMIPQSTPAWMGPAAINADPASGAFLKIRARLEKDGIAFLNNTDAVYIPLAAIWERGKKYTYTLSFDGQSALTPITFSVSDVEWENADETGEETNPEEHGTSDNPYSGEGL